MRCIGRIPSARVAPQSWCGSLPRSAVNGGDARGERRVPGPLDIRALFVYSWRYPRGIGIPARCDDKCSAASIHSYLGDPGAARCSSDDCRSTRVSRSATRRHGSHRAPRVAGRVPSRSPAERGLLGSLVGTGLRLLHRWLDQRSRACSAAGDAVERVVAPGHALLHTSRVTGRMTRLVAGTGTVAVNTRRISHRVSRVLGVASDAELLYALH